MLKANPTLAVPLKPIEDTEVLRYRLSKDCIVQVVYTGAITQGSIERLCAHLDLTREAYPEDLSGL